MTRLLMLDIETEALTADAVVWAVGLTEFATTATGSLVQTSLYLLSRQHGRRTDPKTVKWTREHGDGGLYDKWNKNVTFGHLSPIELHTAISKTLGDYGEGNYEIWAKGAKFDFAVMQSYFSDYAMATPWHYRAERDMRTLQSTLQKLGVPTDLLEYDKPEIPHNAASDCEAQVKTLARWMGLLEKAKQACARL